MADWVRYAALLGLNPYHPDRWTPAERAEVDRWRLAQFRAEWRWLSARGMPALFRQQSGRAALIRRVRDDLDLARAPLPPRPYPHCPCHPHRVGSRLERVDPWNVDRPPGVPPAIAALNWLGQTFGRTGDRR